MIFYKFKEKDLKEEFAIKKSIEIKRNLNFDAFKDILNEDLPFKIPLSDYRLERIQR